MSYLNQMLNEYLSSVIQEKRMDRMRARTSDQAYKMVYDWVKNKTITVEEFKELITWYEKRQTED